MDKKNWWVILALVLVIGVIAIIGFVLPKQSGAPIVTVTDPGGVITTLAPEPTATDAPATEAPATEIPASDTPATDAPATDSPATAAPAAETDNAAPATEAPAAEQEKTSPRGWLLITVDDKVYTPYALTKTGDYTINQKKKNAKNVIHVTEDSIQMASSTCDNQVCVYEGEVTLENKESRILGGYIVCLPNGVTLQLLDENEYAELTGQTP